MSVEFDNNWDTRPNISEASPKMISFLISKGIVKNESQAKMFLFIATGICVAVAFYLLLSQKGPTPDHIGKTPVPPGIEVGGFSN